MLVTATSGTGNSIDLIKENCAWSVEAGHFEQDANKLLRFSAPLGGKTGDRYVEEGSFTLGGNSFGQHGLTSTWRSEHADSFPGSSDTSKVLRHEDGKKDCLLKKLLGIIKISNVIKVDVWILVDNFPLHHLDQVYIWASPVRIVVLEESCGFLFLLLWLLPWLLVVAASSSTARIGLVILLLSWIRSLPSLTSTATASVLSCSIAWSLLRFASAPVIHRFLGWILRWSWRVPNIRIFRLRRRAIRPDIILPKTVCGRLILSIMLVTCILEVVLNLLWYMMMFERFKSAKSIMFSLWWVVLSCTTAEAICDMIQIVIWI